MNKPDEETTNVEVDIKWGGCGCGDPYASLPAELRPKPAAKADGLHQVTCPKCGLIYRTNRRTDGCVRCEETETA